MERPLIPSLDATLLLDTNILIDVLRGEAVALRQSHGLTLATRNVRDFPLTLGSVLHPYGL